MVAWLNAHWYVPVISGGVGFVWLLKDSIYVPSAAMNLIVLNFLLAIAWINMAIIVCVLSGLIR